MCEIAKNSVMQSGFELAVKCHWLGPQTQDSNAYCNDVAKSNVPTIRVSFRNSLLLAEREFLQTGVATALHFRDSPDISSTCKALEDSLQADLDH